VCVCARAHVCSVGANPRPCPLYPNALTVSIPTRMCSLPSSATPSSLSYSLPFAHSFPPFPTPSLLSLFAPPRTGPLRTTSRHSAHSAGCATSHSLRPTPPHTRPTPPHTRPTPPHSAPLRPTPHCSPSSLLPAPPRSSLSLRHQKTLKLERPNTGTLDARGRPDRARRMHEERGGKHRMVGGRHRFARAHREAVPREVVQPPRPLHSQGTERLCIYS
jgi:hypothetical protein